ncbi:MAG: hypothetical protein HY808_00405 [Nitrospirae bacterium]|nr:hypothetical protein [Nitrospirota bacterium]
MKLPFTIKEREKKFLMIGGIAVLAIIIFNTYTWYSDLKKSADEAADNKRFMLEKQLNRMAGKNEVEKKVNAFKIELEGQEKLLLQGEKPPVAAAELQRILKEAAMSLSIGIASERTLNPVEEGPYLGVPVEVGFSASTEKLKDFLLKVRTTPFLIKVSDMKIRVTNISNPTDVFTTLVVTGFIKKPQEAETKGREEKKEVKKEAKNEA